MMNIKAIALLLCSLGTAMLFSPQPYLEMSGESFVADKGGGGGGGGGGSSQLGNINPEAAAKHAASAATGAFQSTADSVRKTADQIWEAGESGIRRLGEAAGVAKQSVKHFVGNAVTCMKEEAEAAVKCQKMRDEGGREVGSVLADDAKQTIEAAGEKSTSLYESVREKANPETAEEAISDTVASAKESVTQLASKAFKKDGTNASTLWKKAESGRDEALQAVEKMRGLLMQGINLSEGGEERVAQKVQEYFESIKKSFEDCASKIEYMEAIKEAVRETTKTGTNVDDAFLGLSPKQELTTQEFVRRKIGIHELGVELGGNVTERTKQLFEDVKETITDLFKLSKDQLPDLSLEGKHFQFDKKRSVKGEVRRRGEWLEEKLEEAGHKANKAAGMIKGSLGRLKSILATRTCMSFQSLLRLLHLFSFSTIYGTSLWVTFLSGLILSRSTSKQQFGYLQSQISPIYLRIMALGEALLLLTHALLHSWPTADFSERWQYQILFWPLVMTLLNIKLLEPLSTKIMLERLKMEKEEGRGLRDAGELEALDDETQAQIKTINQRFYRMHNYSSAANLASLACLTYHLWHLDRRFVI